MNSAILVTGGAGYIGSHTVQALIRSGFETIVLDSLVSGHRTQIPSSVLFYQGDIADVDLITEIVVRHDVKAVIHFAARSQVGESVLKPDFYFHENTAKTNLMLSALLQCGVKHLVFSSTAAVYGIPEVVPIPEDSQKNPTNPYGASKYAIEQTFPWLELAYGMKWISLRYFNAGGAALDSSIGERHDPETHLIPNILQAALDKHKEIVLYGTDYDTPDGTCIRDYIHVVDLAEAHVIALDALLNGQKSGAFNLGSGIGYSVREVIAAAKQVTGKEISVRNAGRRQGDPAILIADASKFQSEFGWYATHSELETILETAWLWYQKICDLD